MEQDKQDTQAGAHVAAQLFAAYTKAYAEIQNVTKNATNPHYSSDYATLDAVIDAVKPVFAKHGLAVYQAPGRLAELAGNLIITVVSVLMHESGAQMQIETQVPLGGKATAQAAGGAITYARRYALAAIAGIAQVDDDGNAASGRATKQAGADEDELAEAIKAATTREELNELEEAVQESGSKALVSAFVDKRSALKKAKKS